MVTNLPMVDLYGFVISRQPWKSDCFTYTQHGPWPAQAEWNMMKNEQRTPPCNADTSLYPLCFGARQKRKQELAVQMRASLITGSTKSPKGASLSRMDSFHGTRSFHGHPKPWDIFPLQCTVCFIFIIFLSYKIKFGVCILHYPGITSRAQVSGQ